MFICKYLKSNFSIEMIKEFRKLTGASMLNCKNAYEKFNDISQAAHYIQEQNLINSKNIASKPSDIGIFTFIKST